MTAQKSKKSGFNAPAIGQDLPKGTRYQKIENPEAPKRKVVKTTKKK